MFTLHRLRPVLCTAVACTTLTLTAPAHATFDILAASEIRTANDTRAIDATGPGATSEASRTAMEREREKLFTALKLAPNAHASRVAEDAIWRFWMRGAPAPEIEKRVAEAMQARSGYDFEKAREILNDVVARAPTYAEGWNQRAFIHYLQGKPDRSLADIDRALELEPKHFGALAGKARILMEQGRVGLGQKALRRAIGIHPWLRERSMLLPVPNEKEI